MGIFHDATSLPSSNEPVFKRDTTSLKTWAAEDAAAKAELERKSREAAELNKLRTTYGDNNLDLSWHGARVAFVDIKGKNSLESIYLSNLNTLTVLPSAYNNSQQWFRIEKVKEGDISSLWRIIATSPEGKYYILGDGLTDKSIGFFNPPESVLNSEDYHWLISFESGGSLRLRNAKTARYIGVGEVDTERPAANGVKCIPATNGVLTDQQRWHLRRLPTDEMMDNNLDLSWHNIKVNIYNRNGMALDIAGLSSLESNSPRIPWGWPWDRTNSNQSIRLEKVNPTDAASPWLLVSSKDSIIYQQGEKIANGANKAETRNTPSYQWQIGYDASGGFCFKNAESGNFLQLASLVDVDGTALQVMPRAVKDAKAKQMWQMERLLNTSIVDARSTSTLDDSFNSSGVFVYVTDPASTRYLDFGGADKETRRVWFQLAPAAGPNNYQKIRLEKLSDPGWNPSWTLKCLASERWFLKPQMTSASSGNVVSPVAEATPKPLVDEYKWHIRSTSQPDYYRIQSRSSLLFLEQDKVENDVVLKPLDLSTGNRQLFMIKKVK